MEPSLTSIKEVIHFKIRFNTMHGDTDFYWRVIIGDKEFLAHSVLCKVTTYSDQSFDVNANAVKYHMGGQCSEFYIDENRKAIFL